MQQLPCACLLKHTGPPGHIGGATLHIHQESIEVDHCTAFGLYSTRIEKVLKLTFQILVK